MDNEHSSQISGKERFVYFGLIPFIFTMALIGVGAVIVKHGQSESFTGAILQAGQHALDAGKRAFGGKPSPSAAPATPAAVGQANTSGPAAQQPSSNSNGQTASAGNPQAAAGTTATQPQNNQQPNPSPPPPDPNVAWKQKTDGVASEFSKMSPSQAASIIGNMGLKDEVFTMIGMKAQQRSDILAKMDPKQAAAISKELENFPSGGSGDISAMQQQLDRLPNTSQPLDELVKTYTQMPAQSAAVLIIELMKTNQKEAVAIMSKLDAATRANLLSAMSSNKTDPNSLKDAAQISEILAQAK